MSRPKTIALQPLFEAFSKGVLLPFKCSPFSVQKDSFYRAKGPHLQAKRTTFEKQVKSFIIKTGFF